MRIRKGARGAIILFCSIAGFILLSVILPWVLLFIGIALSPNPPKPEIKYGEFPFQLTYEINGETKVIKDTIICVYDGIGMDEGRGKFRKWKQYLASGNEQIILFKQEGAEGRAFPNMKSAFFTIYYNPGLAAFYMGEYGYDTTYRFDFPNASYDEKYEDKSGTNGIIQEDDLFNKYGIKLIRWDHAQPIINHFD